MKAIVKDKNGLTLKDVPIPKIGDFDVLIKVKIAGYCRTDGYIAQNKIKAKLPLILGHEFSGLVEKIGKKVRGLKRGNRVAVMPIIPDRQGYFSGAMIGLDIHGAFAEYVSVPAITAHKIPDSLTFKEAAYLEPVAASLAVLKAPIRKKETGVILGKNRIAKLTLKILSIHGFNSMKLISETDLARVSASSYDFAIETLVNTNNFSQLVRIVRPGGIIILKSRRYDHIGISVGDIVKKNMKIFGTYYGSFGESIKLLKNNKLYVKDIFGKVVGLKDGLKILKGKLDDYEDKKIFFDPTL